MKTWQRLPDLCSDSALRAALLDLEVPLTVIAQDVLGLEGRIDRVARAPNGAIALILRAAAGECRAGLTDAVAQREWLAPRLSDWHQLAPALGIEPALPIRALLLAAEFDPRTRSAAGSVELYQWIALGEDRGVLRPVISEPPAGRTSRGLQSNPVRSTFRTGLRAR